jgi:hypothetical protein
MVVKAPHGSLFTNTIANEIKALGLLNFGTSCANIPQLQNSGDLAINVRGSEVTLKALATDESDREL